MTYQEWIDSHKTKHQKIISKLFYLSDRELLEYFDFDNMVNNEPDFCILYKTNEKCHDMEKLNCYLCGCFYFRFDKMNSFCKIDSIDGKKINSHDGFLHQDCSECSVPHNINFIETNFDRDWENIMKNVKEGDC